MGQEAARVGPLQPVLPGSGPQLHCKKQSLGLEALLAAMALQAPAGRRLFRGMDRAEMTQQPPGLVA